MNASLSTVVIATGTSVLTALATLFVIRATEPTSVAANSSTTPVIAESSDPDALPHSLPERVAQLEEALQQEQQGRLMLQREQARQQQTLANLRSSLDTALNAALKSASTATDEAEASSTAHTGAIADNGAEGFEPGPWSRREPAGGTREALVAAGVESELASALVRQQDTVALAELEVRDRAAREGWLGDSDAGERIEAALTDQQLGRVDLQAELTSRQWDRYLFQTGRPNRVVIVSVLSGSAADAAQIVAGDQLLAYAGKTIFRTRDLQRETRSGQRGESIVVSIGRAGNVLELVVPRGPLGVTLAPDRVDPDAA